MLTQVDVRRKARLALILRARSNPRPGRQVISGKGAKYYFPLTIGMDIPKGWRRLTEDQLAAVEALPEPARQRYGAARLSGRTHAGAMADVGVRPRSRMTKPEKIAAASKASGVGVGTWVTLPGGAQGAVTRLDTFRDVPVAFIRREDGSTTSGILEDLRPSGRTGAVPDKAPPRVGMERGARVSVGGGRLGTIVKVHDPGNKALRPHVVRVQYDNGEQADVLVGNLELTGERAESVPRTRASSAPVKAAKKAPATKATPRKLTAAEAARELDGPEDWAQAARDGRVSRQMAARRIREFAQNQSDSAGVIRTFESERSPITGLTLVDPQRAARATLHEAEAARLRELANEIARPAKAAATAKKATPATRSPALDRLKDAPEPVRELAQRPMADVRKVARYFAVDTDHMSVSRDPAALAESIYESRLRAWRDPDRTPQWSAEHAAEEMRRVLVDVDAAKPAKKAAPAKKATRPAAHPEFGEPLRRRRPMAGDIAVDSATGARGVATRQGVIQWDGGKIERLPNGVPDGVTLYAGSDAPAKKATPATVTTLPGYRSTTARTLRPGDTFRYDRAEGREWTVDEVRRLPDGSVEVYTSEYHRPQTGDTDRRHVFAAGERVARLDAARERARVDAALARGESAMVSPRALVGGTGRSYYVRVKGLNRDGSPDGPYEGFVTGAGAQSARRGNPAAYQISVAEAPSMSPYRATTYVPLDAPVEVLPMSEWRLESLPVSELVRRLEARGLSTQGSREDLIRRLRGAGS